MCLCALNTVGCCYLLYMFFYLRLPPLQVWLSSWRTDNKRRKKVSACSIISYNTLLVIKFCFLRKLFQLFCVYCVVSELRDLVTFVCREAGTPRVECPNLYISRPDVSIDRSICDKCVRAWMMVLMMILISVVLLSVCNFELKLTQQASTMNTVLR